MMKQLLAVLACAVLATACGSSGPTGPSAPPIPQYAGTWTGTYTISGCNQTGGVAAANICGNLGNVAPYGFILTQSARNVSGSFTLGSISFPSTGGTVGQDGSLPLQATTVQSGITIVVTWALNLPVSSLTGTVTQIWTSNVLSGQANVVGTISTANRSAFTARTLFVPRSVQELVTAVGEPAR